MIITKTALPRRTFLRGAGVAIALPLLDGMVPALSALSKTTGKPAPRLAFYYVPNGMYGPNFHPKAAGKDTEITADFEIKPVLQPLAPFRDQMVVVTGLSNSCSDTLSEGGGPHTRSHASYLSGTRPKRTEGSDIECGTTFDQYAARILGTETSLPSLELSIDDTSIGNCDNGYSCAYVNTFSWKNRTTPLPMANNPRVVFERLFGDGGSSDARQAQLRLDRSILDWVSHDVARLRKQLGPRDRRAVDEYLDTVREVERRLQRVEANNRQSPLPAAAQPIGIPDSYHEHAELMFDLQFLAYQADLTRVVTFQISREQSSRAYPWIGVPEGHHGVSHHANEPHNIAQLTKICAYHVSLFARLVERMHKAPDGDGSLLDHSMMLYGAGMGDGDLHMPHNLPIVIMGGGCGRLKGGRYLRYPLDTPMANLGLSLLEKVDVRVETIGDSTGPLVGI